MSVDRSGAPVLAQSLSRKTGRDRALLAVANCVPGSRTAGVTGSWNSATARQTVTATDFSAQGFESCFPRTHSPAMKTFPSPPPPKDPSRLFAVCPPLCPGPRQPPCAFCVFAAQAAFHISGLTWCARCMCLYTLGALLATASACGIMMSSVVTCAPNQLNACCPCFILVNI